MTPPTPPPRPARLVGYTLFTLAGVAAVRWPVPVVESASGWLVYVWAAFLIVGGILSAAGTISDRWIGELIGLPLLVPAFAVCALVLAVSGKLGSVTVGCLLAGIGAKLVARWQDVSCVRREATALARAKGQR